MSIPSIFLEIQPQVASRTLRFKRSAPHSIAQVEVFLKEHLTKAYDRIEENAELFNF